MPHWTVARNVELVPRLLGWERARAEERAAEVLELVGLPRERYGRRYPRELSGGQRQRVAFARALAGDPEVVLLDEPFGALDALTRLELQEEFLGFRERLGKTMLLVTHDLGEAFRLGGRVAVMRAGRVLRAGRPEELRAEPGDEYVAAFSRSGGSDDAAAVGGHTARGAARVRRRTATGEPSRTPRACVNRTLQRPPSPQEARSPRSGRRGG